MAIEDVASDRFCISAQSYHAAFSNLSTWLAFSDAKNGNRITDPDIIVLVSARPAICLILQVK